jgi:hypothetical protein
MFHDIVPSLDGRYFAYVAEDTTLSAQGAYAVVREIGTGRLVFSSTTRGGCDCDVDMNHARWLAPDSFEIAISLIDEPGGWEIVAGRASLRRFHVDRVPKEPVWH